MIDKPTALSAVVPAKAGTHMLFTVDRTRRMGPGSRSLRSVGRDDS